MMGGLRGGLTGGARLAGVPLALGQVAQAMAADAASKDRIPLVVELSGGNDAANSMFIIGKQVRGGHYGKPVNLTQLDAGDNLMHTTDFRRAYATLARGGWAMAIRRRC